MSEDLVTPCEARYVVARCDDNSRRLDAKRQRWSPADLPVAHPDDLVPVADPCRVHRDHDLVRRGSSRRRQLEHVHVAAKRVYAGGLHPRHDHHVPRILEFDEAGSGKACEVVRSLEHRCGR